MAALLLCKELTALTGVLPACAGSVQTALHDASLAVAARGCGSRNLRQSSTVRLAARSFLEHCRMP